METNPDISALQEEVKLLRREQEIEAALEKVRSRSLAMHKSEELQEVVNTVFANLKGLHIQMDGVSLIIPQYDTASFDYWVGTDQGYSTKFSVPDSIGQLNEGVKGVIDALNSGTELNIQTLSNTEKNDYWNFLFNHTDFKHILADRKKFLLEETKAYTASYAIVKNIGIVILRYSDKLFSDQENEIALRFAKVFEQAYTRFLDLQKAEEQTREAQIEVAFEKVRSASMAMHKSDDLLLVIKAVHEQITELGIKVDASNFQTYIENSRDFYIWPITTTHSYQQKLRVTYIDFGMTKKLWDAWEKGESFVELQADAEEMHRWWNKAFEVSELSHTPQHRREIILSAPGWNSIVARGKTCGLQLHRYNLESFTTQEHDILRRLANVFEQSYIRFLDLQKAEAQAREAQIEAALERVRSRSLAMHKSEELRNVVDTLYGEFQSLHVNFHVAAISLFLDDSKDLYLWLSTADGLYDDIIHWPFEDLPIMDEVYKSRATKVLEYTLDKRETEEFFEAYFKLKAVPKERKEATRSVEVIDIFGSFFEQAGIVIMRYSKGAYTENEKDIIRRFAKVFEQTYIRFLDLQKAEAQAREAIKQSSLDRIRGEIASMRDAKDLERITPLVWKELQSLGVPFFRCGVMLVNEEQEVIDFYLSNPQGEALAALRLDFDNSEITRNGVAHWRKQETYVEHWNQEQFLTFMRSLLDQGQISNPTTYQGGEKPPTALTLQFVPFAQGMLYVGSEIDLNAEELDLVKALGKSLSVAYARYEDFTKLDLAKARAEKALKDLEAAQSQLVQQEKLASLGQLTAGIAHEIKNPLNFVNNFSDLSQELIEEVFGVLENITDSDAKEEVIAILQDVKSNLTKVHEHGTRADSIVTSMLQHSRASGSKREPKAFNPLVKEFVNLSFHGMRASKAPINVDIDLQLDPQVGYVTMISEDFSRVILNLCNNAFDAMRDKLKLEVGSGKSEAYLAKLTVKTILQKDKVILSIGDNGGGIPKEIQDKILQPFFTTKKGTDGTGLGLSITDDIVKAHGGTIEIHSKPGETIFKILLTT